MVSRRSTILAIVLDLTHRLFCRRRCGHALTLWWLCRLVSGCHFAEFQHFLRVGSRKKVHTAGDYAGPAGLVIGAQAGPGVPVEVFIKQDEVAPVRVILKLPSAAVERTPAVLVFEKDAG